MSGGSNPNLQVFRLGDDSFIEHAEEDRPRVYWWAITRGSLCYAAIGNSSMEAYQRVSNELGITLDEFLIVPTFSEMYVDDIQAVLARRYGEREAVRLLAFSITEWPNDPDNLTQEQKEHGIQNGWLNPDGTWKE